MEEVQEDDNIVLKDMVPDDMYCETKAEKRKERRQVKLAREREGERRRREGKP